jgi:hypothetical protein
MKARSRKLLAQLDGGQQTCVVKKKTQGTIYFFAFGRNL